jgi:hypothetical protein
MASGPASVHTPDFGVPDMTMPDLRPYNLVEPGIEYVQGMECAPDSLIVDLNEYVRPYGLDFYNLNEEGANIFKPDPVMGEQGWGQDAQGMQVIDHALQVDPAMPDLQHPQLEQEVHMLTRPGDLAPDALRGQPDEVNAVPYEQSFMDQDGMNTTRRRHMDLLLRGLEEQ